MRVLNDFVIFRRAEEDANRRVFLRFPHITVERFQTLAEDNQIERFLSLLRDRFGVRDACAELRWDRKCSQRIEGNDLNDALDAVHEPNVGGDEWALLLFCQAYVQHVVESNTEL